MCLNLVLAFLPFMFVKMNSTVDFAQIDVGLYNAEEKINQGNYKAGIQILLGVSKGIREALREDFDEKTASELKMFQKEAENLILNATRKARCVDPASGLVQPPPKTEINIQNMILHADGNIFLEDLVGMREEKLALLEAVVLPSAFPKDIPEKHKMKGVLIFGVSGVGKSKILMALVNTVEKILGLNITFVNLSLSDVLGNHYGDTERNMSEIFSACGTKTPCVIFIDEIDSLTADRNAPLRDTDLKQINHFLTVLDGIRGGCSVVTIGTTNKPDKMDQSFLRRFPKKLYIDLPDKYQRALILRSLVTPLQPKELPSDIDFDELGEITFRYTPADLCELVTLAHQRVRCREPAEKLLDLLEDGSEKVALNKDLMKTALKQPIMMADMLNAKRVHQASTNEWDISKLERFARDHCPKPINLDEIDSDCSCCTLEQFRLDPCWEIFRMLSRCIECLCHGC